MTGAAAQGVGGLGGWMVEVRVLGPLEVIGDAGVVALSAAKHRRLLAAMLVRPKVIRPADLLIDALWGSRPPRSAEKLLQVYVSQLRKLLPATVSIQTHGSGYAIDIDAAVLDAVRFEDLLAEARKARREGNHSLAASVLGRALALWRGAAYDEFADADFAHAEAQRLEDIRRQALEERIDAELALGRHRELLPELRALAAADPLREKVHGQLMLALYRNGNQAEALEVYRRVRTSLVDELGVEPAGELRELQQSILRHDDAVAAPTETLVRASHAIELPSPPNPLRGRERELHELRSLLLRDDVRLVVLTGAGGSGKTRLALEVARRVHSMFGDGAAFVSLAAVRDPAILATALAGAFGLQDVGGDHLDALAAHLRTREVLLVLDNLEQLRAGASALVALLSRAPRLKLLVTSRVVLHVSGEHVYPVDPLPAVDAATLFTERAKTADPRFAPDDDDTQHIAEICRRLDCLPLAIELAASHVRVFTPKELLTRLDARLPVLVGGPSDLPARQQTLRATLEWSFDQLDDVGRSDLTALSVFAGGCTADGAAAVLGVPELAPHRLLTLVDHSLLVRVSAAVAGGSRYTMLEMVREFAAERLAASGARDVVRRRHAEYALALARTFGLSIDALSTGAPKHYELAALEQENMRAALDWAECADPRLGLELMAALEQFWVANSPRESARRLEALLSAAADLPVEVRAAALRDLGGSLEVSGDWRQAGARYAESRALFRDIGDEPGELRAMHRLALIALVCGDLAQVLDLAGDGLRRARAGGYRYEESEFLRNLGTVELRRGNVEEAYRLEERSLTLLRGVGPWPWGETSRLRTMAEAASMLGRHCDAWEHGHEALVLARATGDKIKTLLALASLALIARRRGDDGRAGRLWGAIEAEEQRSFLGWWATYRGPYVAEVPSDPSPEFERARAEGTALTLDEVVAELLGG